MPVSMNTIVQHSGFGYAHNPQFEQAVEDSTIPNKKSLERVKEAGGLIFEGYVEAYETCEKINYPPEVRELIPEARGSFSNKSIDGLKIYIPAKNDNL